MKLGEELLAEPQDVAADDVAVTVLDSRPLPEPMLAASVDHVLAVASGPPVADQVPQRTERIADDVIAAGILSRQGDDSALAARQSA